MQVGHVQEVMLENGVIRAVVGQKVLYGKP